LATILVANNFINVGIVILSSWLTEISIDFSANPGLEFLFQVVIITFFILFFGEILPKVYATTTSISFARKTSYPIFVTYRMFSPVTNFLLKSTTIVNKYLVRKENAISIKDVSQAYELTESNIKEDKEILEGIINFTNIEVREIMKPRIDIVAADLEYDFNKLKSMILESGYSRIPVYEGTHDTVKGILFIKDLLPHINEKENFKWQEILREPYFVPETMKIHDLLEEFQIKKIHIAIVTDEYGGVKGIATMEDIIEEIIGEISDEDDNDDELFIKIDDYNYVFEGKILLNDFYKVLSIKEDIFEKERGDADSLAGMILELKGEIPVKGTVIPIKNFTFVVDSSDNRKIKKIKLNLKNE
jgi:gliding motility-associated protein GldE